MSALLLFDIDGTLLLSGRAGVRSMTIAFERLFGVADAFAGIEIAGRTDSYLLSQALEHARLSDTAEAHERFRTTYLEILADEIHRPGEGRKEVMPGIRELLATIGGDPMLHAALLTGNYQDAARIKLSYFQLTRFFEWGAFGEEASDRNELARRAMERAIERAVPPDARANTCVIGDTPHDIACARAIGARAIAVATGVCGVEELSTAKPDAIFEDLRDTQAVLDALL